MPQDFAHFTDGEADIAQDGVSLLDALEEGKKLRGA